MNRDKQIEEMQLVMLNAIYLRYYNTSDVKANNEKEFLKQAKALYEAGYRKASDVAREIFEEIEENILGSHYLKSYEWNAEAYEELKKKYTESEGEG